MNRLRDWQLGLIILGTVALGVGLSVLLGTDSRSSGRTTGAAASVVLADPMDPPEKGIPGPTVATPKPEESGATLNRSELLEKATSGDREQLTAVKEILKRRVASGTGTDADAAMLRGLCKQLGDENCSK